MGMYRILIALTLIAAAPLAERVVTDTAFATRAGDDPVRLLIDPGAPAMPILTEQAAASAGLKAGPFGISYRVGPVTVSGRSAVGRIGLGDTPGRRRIGWTSKPYAKGYDGVIGPGGLPQPVVRFVLRPALPGERTVALPLDDGGGLFGNWGASDAIVTVGAIPVRVRFTLARDETVATAGAALTLAGALGGTLDPTGTEAEIAFGVRRPVRTLRLKQPLTVGPLALSSLFARTRDFGNADGIVGTDAVADPDEVVVTAKGARDHHRDRITVGRTALARCSSIVFDKTAKQVRLTCG